MKYLKPVLIVFILVFAATGADAQYLHWVKDTVSLLEAGGARMVAPDNFGNVYTVGAGPNNVVLKHNAANGSVKWYNSWLALTYIGDCSVIAESTSDLYVYGYQSSSPYGVMVNRIDSNGNLLWTNRIACTGKPWGIANDNRGHVFATGTFTSPTLVAGTTTLYNAAGSFSGFIVKYDTTGSVIWAKEVSATKKAYIYDITCDAIGNFFIAGRTDTSDLTIDGVTISLPWSGPNMFVAKCDTHGHLLWLTANKHRFIASSFDRELVLSADAAGNAYLGGNMYDSDTIGSIPTSIRMTGLYYQNAFVAKYYGSTGKVPWAHTSGSTGGFGSLATNAAGRTVAVFESESPSYFGDSVFYNTGAAAISNGTIVSIDSDGTIQCALLLGGEAGGEGGSDVTGVGVDAKGAAYICGDYLGLCTFGDTTLNSGLTERYFLTKFSCDSTIDDSDPGESLGYGGAQTDAGFKVYPNPANNVMNVQLPELTGAVELTLTDNVGRQLRKLDVSAKKGTVTVDINRLPPGIYYIKVTSASQVFSQKIEIH